MSKLKNLLGSLGLGTRKTSGRPTRRDTRRLSLENLEDRVTPTVSAVEITSIAAEGDRDGNLTNEHVSVTPSTAVTVNDGLRRSRRTAPFRSRANASIAGMPRASR